MLTVSFGGRQRYNLLSVVSLWAEMTPRQSHFFQICHLEIFVTVQNQCVYMIVDASPRWCCGHLVQGSSFHQLKWRGVYAYLLHINWFVQLCLFPGFDLQPIRKQRDGLRANRVCKYWLESFVGRLLSVGLHNQYLLWRHGVSQLRGCGLLSKHGEEDQIMKSKKTSLQRIVRPTAKDVKATMSASCCAPPSPRHHISEAGWGCHVGVMPLSELSLPTQQQITDALFLWAFGLKAMDAQAWSWYLSFCLAWRRRGEESLKGPPDRWHPALLWGHSMAIHVRVVTSDTDEWACPCIQWKWRVTRVCVVGGGLLGCGGRNGSITFFQCKSGSLVDTTLSVSAR